MKHQLIILFGLFMILILGSFKTFSIKNDDLLIENQLLKEQIAQFEMIDSSKSKTIIELNRMNVVYRGVSNPMTISMPDAVKFEASAPGLKKIDDYGNYQLAPGSGLKVDVSIKGIMKNGNVIEEIKNYRIKDIGKPIGTLNGEGCVNCKFYLNKNDITTGKIGVKVGDFVFDLDFRVYRFKLKLPDGNIIEVKSNKFNNEAKFAINNLIKGESIIVYDIGIMCLTESFKMPTTTPLLIEIIE